MTDVLQEERIGRSGHKETQRPRGQRQIKRRPCEVQSRDWNYASVSQRMPQTISKFREAREESFQELLNDTALLTDDCRLLYSTTVRI